MNAIKIKADGLRQRIAETQRELSILQDKCPHTNVIVTHHGDTGNYDPTQDCYWKQYTCPDCLKSWSVDNE